MEKLLSVQNLTIELKTRKADYNIVENVSFYVNRGETFGIVGESGCGKSLTAYSIIGLLSSPPLYIKGGSIEFEGKDLRLLDDNDIRKLRGNKISMIFQEPMTALDPLFTVGSQIKEVLKIHTNISDKEMEEKTKEILKKVGIPRVESIVNEYPHQLSGGMLQRVMIGMAMINNPQLLIADEPTTALDVTIQAQILDLMNQLKQSYNTSIIMITHDLGVISETCDRVAVFYGGHVVEISDVQNIFENPMHPYTNGLVKSVTSIGHRGNQLYTIPGVVPTIDQIGKGCRFYDRCAEKMDICMNSVPPLKEYSSGHICKCWLYEEV